MSPPLFLIFCSLNLNELDFLRYIHLSYSGNRDNMKLSLGFIIPAKSFIS